MEFSDAPFFIEKQESLATDKFSKNGRTVDLHIVAKNIAFVIHVAAAFDLNLSPPTAKLIYDFDRVEDEKDVEALKCAPLEHTAHVDETGHKAAVEAKIGVLSSQHEGAYFRVKFSVVDPVTQAVLEEFSQPIKVISKRNQVKKMLERKQIPKNLELSSAVSPINAIASSSSSGTKRPASDPSVSEVLLRMEQQQREQLQLLQQIVQQNSSKESSSSQPIKQRVPIPDPDDMDFETAFSTFLKAYTKIPQEERTNKIRKVLKKTANTDNENLTEFIGIYSGSQTNNSDSTKTCQCQDCPHKQFSRLDTFYHDFLSDPLSPEMV